MVALLQVNRFVEETLAEVLPGGGVFSGFCGQGLAHALAELLITPGTTGTAKNGEFAREAALPVELEQGRHQFAMG